MPDIIKNGVVDMAELSRQNGRSELENFKSVIQLLAMKAEIFQQDQTIVATLKENKEE